MNLYIYPLESIYSTMENNGTLNDNGERYITLSFSQIETWEPDYVIPCEVSYPIPIVHLRYS